MQNVDRLFVLTGLVFLLAGMIFGLYMGGSQDHRFIPVHAHLNLLGFTLMMLFGIGYHVWPAMKEGLLSKIHYGIHTIGVIVSMVAVYNIQLDPGTNGPIFGPVADGSATLTLLGVLVFMYLFVRRGKS